MDQVNKLLDELEYGTECRSSAQARVAVIGKLRKALNASQPEPEQPVEVTPAETKVAEMLAAIDEIPESTVLTVSEESITAEPAPPAKPPMPRRSKRS